MIQQLGLIGCGLMGGSLALALKRAGLVQRVVGFSPSERTRQTAVELGVVDAAVTSAAQAAQGSDVIVIAVPVAATQPSFEAIRDVITPHTLVMDVGSTKQDVILAAQVLGERLPCFVPAHPIAGKEVAGVVHAEASLYAGKKVILTPTEATNPALCEKAQAIWQAVGSQVSTMSAARHDAVFAAVSHLPHVIAFAAVNALAAQPQADALLNMAGPGFRDFSRIAASDPAVWRDILLANRDEVLAQAKFFQAQMALLQTAIEQGDAQALSQLIESARQTRGPWRMNQQQD
jgi:prephenate dehydrogenase